MKKTTRILSFLPILLLLAISGCREEYVDVSSESTIPVRVEILELKSIREYVTATGTVFAAKEMILMLEQAGYYQLQTNPRTNPSISSPRETLLTAVWQALRVTR